MLSVKVLFLPKNPEFLQKECRHQQNEEGLGKKKYIF